MPITKAVFQSDLLELSEDALVKKYYFDEQPSQISLEDVDHAAKMLGAAYQVSWSEIEIIVSGSARLGFTTIDKVNKDGEARPAYSSFNADSDIDLAVICDQIFEKIWNELSYHAARKTHFPWSQKKLGNYLISGWLRPDHFPNISTSQYLGEWWPTFDRISRHTRFGRRKVRGGLFYSRYQLEQYLKRSLREVKMAEQLK